MAVFDGFQLVDLAGPADVFNAASVLGGKPLYEVEVVAARVGHVRASNGIEVKVSRAIGDATAPVDTVLVTGGLPSEPPARTRI